MIHSTSVRKDLSSHIKTTGDLSYRREGFPGHVSLCDKSKASSDDSCYSCKSGVDVYTTKSFMQKKRPSDLQNLSTDEHESSNDSDDFVSTFNKVKVALHEKGDVLLIFTVLNASIMIFSIFFIRNGLFASLVLASSAIFILSASCVFIVMYYKLLSILLKHRLVSIELNLLRNTKEVDQKFDMNNKDYNNSFSVDIVASNGKLKLQLYIPIIIITFEALVVVMFSLYVSMFKSDVNIRSLCFVSLLLLFLSIISITITSCYILYRAVSVVIFGNKIIKHIEDQDKDLQSSSDGNFKNQIKNAVVSELDSQNTEIYSMCIAFVIFFIECVFEICILLSFFRICINIDNNSPFHNALWITLILFLITLSVFLNIAILMLVRYFFMSEEIDQEQEGPSSIIEAVVGIVSVVYNKTFYNNEIDLDEEGHDCSVIEKHSENSDIEHTSHVFGSENVGVGLKHDVIGNVKP